MISDFIQRIVLQDNLYELMSGCFYFITYKFNVCGFHISILNTIIVCESFDILMTFVGKMFGKTEVDN